jgi:hypothetical protein
MCGSGGGGRPAIISNYSPLNKAFEYFGGGTDRYTIAQSATGFNVVAYTLTDGGSAFGYLNGSQTFTSTPAQTISGLSIIRIGSAISEAFAKADMGEVLIYGRVLSPTERQRVDRGLGRKWGITVA